MNIRRAILVLFFSLAALSLAADSPIEFSGVMTAGGKTMIALTDTSTKTTTWVEPGQDFRGFTVARYDAKEDVVFLKKGGHETRLALVASKTPEITRSTATPASNSMSSLAAESTATAIRANLR